MLLAGEIDAAIVGERPSDPRLKTVIPDPTAAADAWRRRTGALQVNHVLVVKESLAKICARAAGEVVRLFAESKRAAGLPVPGMLDMNPIGREANRRNLEVAIDCVYRQGMIPERFEPEDVREALTIPAHIPVMIMDARRRISVIETLLSLVGHALDVTPE